MKKAAVAATMAALILLAAGSGPADAQVTYDRPETICSDHEIDHSDATCLHGEWTNWGTTPALGRASVTVRNDCASYGKLVVSVDMDDDTDDIRVTMSKGHSTAWPFATRGHASGIACCLDQSALCYKNQVEASSQNQIAHIVISGTDHTTTMTSVATHQERYDFCQANPNYIYCTVNPSGDALTDPSAPTGNCDGSPCTVQDCLDEFSDSPAAGTPSSCTSLNIVRPAWTGDGEAPTEDDEYVLVNDECEISSLSCTDSEDNTVSPGMHPPPEAGANARVAVSDMDALRYCEFSVRQEDELVTVKRIVNGDCPANEE